MMDSSSLTPQCSCCRHNEQPLLLSKPVPCPPRRVASGSTGRPLRRSDSDSLSTPQQLGHPRSPQRSRASSDLELPPLTSSRQRNRTVNLPLISPDRVLIRSRVPSRSSTPLSRTPPSLPLPPVVTGAPPSPCPPLSPDVEADDTEVSSSSSGLPSPNSRRRSSGPSLPPSYPFASLYKLSPASHVLTERVAHPEPNYDYLFVQRAALQELSNWREGNTTPRQPVTTMANAPLKRKVVILGSPSVGE